MSSYSPQMSSHSPKWVATPPKNLFGGNLLPGSGLLNLNFDISDLVKHSLFIKFPYQQKNLIATGEA